jgi:excisionase family DNA binding protein
MQDRASPERAIQGEDVVSNETSPSVAVDANPQLMTVEQVAQYFQLAPSTVYHWLCDGRLRHVKLGSAVRVRRQDLDRFVLQRLRQNGKGQKHESGNGAVSA